MTTDTDCQTLAEMFQQSVRTHGHRPFIGSKTDGRWTWTSYGQFEALVSKMRLRLMWMGVHRGDRVAVIANNRLEWAICAFACYSMGAVYVPMYESQSPADRAYIINDCKPTVLFAANDSFRDEVLDGEAGRPNLRWIVSFDSTRDAPVLRIADVLAHAPETVSYGLLMHNIRIRSDGCRLIPKNPMYRPYEQPKPDDLACLIYTSGTTGNPKGVMLTHGNIASNIEAVRELNVITCEDRSLSFLPWAHVFGHTVELQGVMRTGGSMAICEGIDKILDNLAEVQPTVLFTVPNVFSRVHSAVLGQIAAEPRIVQWLFSAGIAAANRKREAGSAGTLGQIALFLATKLMFSKAYQRFGGKLRLAVCGGAALPKDVGAFIDAIGIPTYVGYGMTETSPVATVNCPGNNRLGTGGKAIRGVTITIDTSVTDDPRDGEIVISGPNVMKGYYNLPDETAKAIDDRGRMRTGDVGHVDADGYLHVTDRLNERYKLLNGKYVAPAPIEDLAKKSPLVANVMVYGLNRPYNVALVVPNLQALRAALNGNGRGKDGRDVLGDASAKALVLRSVQEATADCKGYERIKGVALLPEDFTQQNGLMTPTMKVMRRKVVMRYADLIAKLYE